MSRPVEPQEFEIGVDGDRLVAHFRTPRLPRATVICVHPGPTGQLAQAEHEVASALTGEGFATLLVGLSTAREDRERAVVDVPRLAERVLCATRMLSTRGTSSRTPLGYLGVGDAAAAALVATAMEPRRVRALVARSSRPERAGMSLMLTRTPTLFIVSEDQPDERVASTVACKVAAHARLEIVPPAPTLGGVASLTAAWFSRWLSPRSANAWVDALPSNKRGVAVDHPLPIR